MSSGKDDDSQMLSVAATIAPSDTKGPATAVDAPIAIQQTLAPHDVYDDGTSQTLARGQVLEQVVRAPGSRVSRGAPALVRDAAAALDESGPRYERDTLLGEGGMGQVWLTRDGRIGRRVAMKIIRSESSDAGEQARFLREARVQGQLEHPAVVPVYDIGHASDGEVFFTMKRVRGNTLSDVLGRLGRGEPSAVESYSLRRLLTAFSQVCLAVEFAHTRGVLHRDLKPDNLMLGDHGEVYVLDWGVARVLSDDLDTDQPIATGDLIAKMAALGNRTGIIGTPGYIAPEQLKGRPIGPTADVFALGAILFEIIALRPLVADKTAIGRLEATFSGIDTAGILAELERPISPELAALCVRATVADPEHRLATAREMHTAIEAFLDGERDQQVRLELAERHITAGRAAMEAGAHDLEAHKRALREVGRALAVVPDHPEARALILQLFSSPPSTSPPEVEQAIETDQAQQSRITAKNGALGMASMAFFLPILVLLGIRSWLGIGLFIAMALGAAGVSAVVSRRQQRSVGLLYLVVFFNNLVFGMCAGLYGSLVLVPAMVITNTITFALHLGVWPRRFAVLTACLAVAVPVVLPIFGLLPASYIPSGDGILLRPLWLAFPPTATLLFITIGTLIAIVNGTRAVGQVRDSLVEAERRVRMQRWQLSQLLPEEQASTAPEKKS